MNLQPGMPLPAEIAQLMHMPEPTQQAPPVDAMQQMQQMMMQQMMQNQPGMQFPGMNGFNPEMMGMMGGMGMPMQGMMGMGGGTPGARGECDDEDLFAGSDQCAENFGHREHEYQCARRERRQSITRRGYANGRWHGTSEYPRNVDLFNIGLPFYSRTSPTFKTSHPYHRKEISLVLSSPVNLATLEEDSEVICVVEGWVRLDLVLCVVGWRSEVVAVWVSSSRLCCSHF